VIPIKQKSCHRLNSSGEMSLKQKCSSRMTTDASAVYRTIQPAGEPMPAQEVQRFKRFKGFSDSEPLETLNLLNLLNP
jgi:hypothetical protein